MKQELKSFRQEKVCFRQWLGEQTRVFEKNMPSSNCRLVHIGEIVAGLGNKLGQCGSTSKLASECMSSATIRARLAWSRAFRFSRTAFLDSLSSRK